jgi:formamidase
MKSIKIDRTKHLCDDAKTGHNRWHPELEVLLEVEPGEEVGFETRDAGDNYLTPESTEADFAEINFGAIHPLTGPVLVKGARPGDLLEVEYLDITPEKWGFTCCLPGRGYLRDTMTTPFLAHWNLSDGLATSPQIPRVHLRGNPFMGISGVAPSQEQLETWTRREAEAMAKGAMVLPPDPTGAVPSEGPPAKQGLRTIPPRENGGNFDVKQLTKGAKLFLPVNVEGALFSTGDAHFTQGDGEVCLTAVETQATCVVRFKVHRGEAERHNIRWPRFSRSEYFTDPKWAVPQKFVATMGMPVNDKGVNEAENLNLACRNAVLSMMQLLQERGYTREQAYVICSVAVDLKINNVVDLPNVVVSAYLPEEVFQG